MSSDAMYSASLLWLFILAPVLMVALRRTRFWWASATTILCMGVAMFASIEPVEDDVGGIGALGNGMAYIISFFLFTYGGVGLLATALAYARHCGRVHAERDQLPTATVV